jgi:Rho-binding antiterminator
MEEEYKPVNCDFYDELEALATKHKSVEMIFNNNGAKSVIKATISDLYTREKVEYLKTNSGLEIRLDKLVEVDGKQASAYC